MAAAKKTRMIIGVDEVGRGPLAGPVAVGVAMASEKTLRKWGTIKESKQLSERQREEWYAKIIHPESGIDFAVSFVSASSIDTHGINPSIRKAMRMSLQKLSPNPALCTVLLDGGLVAPEEFKNQTTIIRGDATETIIAIASVVAKVERDRRMVRLAKKHPEYGFERHKGYGTKAHYEAIKKHHITEYHRKTFLSGMI